MQHILNWLKPERRYEGFVTFEALMQKYFAKISQLIDQK